MGFEAAMLNSRKASSRACGPLPSRAGAAAGLGTDPKGSVFIPNPKARLFEQVREVLRFHHYALRTEETYLQWIKRFLVFHRRSPIPHPLPLSTPHDPSPGLRPPSSVQPERGHPMGEGSVGEGQLQMADTQGWQHPRTMG